MATPRKPAAEPRTCEAPDCAVTFTPKLVTARFHSATCRQRAARARKAVEAERGPTAEPDGDDAEHGLVTAVRTELATAKMTDTVRGQLALQLARRISSPNEPGVPAMFDRLTKLMDEVLNRPALIGAPASAPATPSDDEVTKARAARDAKLAAASEAADRA